MNLIDQIKTKDQLLSVRDHFGKVLAETLSLNLKPRKLDEIAALLLGSADFNAALSKADEVANLKRMGSGIMQNNFGPLCIIENIHSQSGRWIEQYIEESFSEELVFELGSEMDEIVFDHVGTHPWVSEKVNNKGLAEQITQVGMRSGLKPVWESFMGYDITEASFMTWYHKKHEAPICQNGCSQELDIEGYCQDETCPYQDWPQKIDVGDLESMSQVDIEIRYNLCKRVRVMAVTYSDDRVTEVEFDASAYFASETIAGRLGECLSDLAACKFGGDDASDNVARYFEKGGSSKGQEGVKVMFDYLAHIPETGKNRFLRGFECHVDKASLALWVKQYYPDIYNKTKALFE